MSGRNAALSFSLMNKTVLILLIIAASAIISWSVRQTALNRITRQLYRAAYVDKDTALFESLVNSLQAQMFIADKSRKIMSLNCYISMQDEDKVIEICRAMNGRKLDSSEFMAFFGSAIGFLCDRGNPYAETLLNEMRNRYASGCSVSEQMLLHDCELTCDVYINRNTGRIPDIEEILKGELDDEQRAIYEYRLAKLYYYDDNKARAKELLKSAKNHTANKASQKKIDGILSGNWSLL